MINNMKKILLENYVITMNIKRLFLLLLLLMITISCSSGQQRREAAEEIGEVIYQKKPNSKDRSDTIIVRNNGDGCYYLLHINESAIIKGSEKLNINCSKERGYHNAEGKSTDQM